ncbi:hypothetical protein KIPB_005689 [Kipferlia bialata]|uniref:Calcineurin-like phosphoesterase domain-containing protein n=1 Tax=Kipferlia bialata TaxID=797122 RepID=A0A9K3GJ91_9EUKA|nr:hypothetical protein KIPB_005689 [Kipferlia bialata]|eukprot:g5689.t1
MGRHTQTAEDVMESQPIKADGEREGERGTEKHDAHHGINITVLGVVTRVSMVLGTMGLLVFWIGLGFPEHSSLARALSPLSSNSAAMPSQVQQRGTISEDGFPAQPASRNRLVCDIEGPLSSAPSDRPRLLLCHNPDRRSMAQAAEAGADIVCSGHTHAGQMWPFNIAVRLAYKQFFAGHSLVESDQRDHPMHAVVTSGAGCWGLQPPEVPHQERDLSAHIYIQCSTESENGRRCTDSLIYEISDIPYR